MTTIYVTHDQAEALSLSDTVAVMERGRFLQVGSPRDIYERPTSRAVAQFIGQINVLDATPADPPAVDGRRRFVTPIGAVATDATDMPASDGPNATLLIRPENVIVSPPAGEASNLFAGRVAFVMYYGDRQDLQIRAGEQVILARVHGAARFAVGDDVKFHVAPRHVAVV